MFPDNTLTPREVTRMCALGTLTEGPLTYAALASEIRRFISYIMGPSLEVLGSSIELLKYEGLVSLKEGNDNHEILVITDKGRAEFHSLLVAGIRPSDSDLNKLITALKLRFLSQLSIAEQREQITILEFTFEEQLARLIALRGQYSIDNNFFSIWLDREINELEGRIKWITQYFDKLN